MSAGAFLKPELPDKGKKRAISTSASTTQPQQPQQPVVEEATGLQPAKEEEEKKRRLVLRGKMPNTVGFWADAMLANAAYKSFDDNYRLTCLCAMQQREKNDVPRQPRKVHWDYVLEEAGWLRRDFREERAWKTRQARKRAEACVEVWGLRVKERGRFVVEDDYDGGSGGGGEVMGSSALGYRRDGRFDDRSGGVEVAVRVKGADGGDSEDGVLGKRKWSAASQGGEDVQERTKRPRDV